MMNYRGRPQPIVVVAPLLSSGVTPDRRGDDVQRTDAIAEEAGTYRTASGGAGSKFTDSRGYHVQFTVASVDARLTQSILHDTDPAPALDMELDPRDRRAIEALRGSLNPERAQTILDDPWFRRASSQPAPRSRDAGDLDPSVPRDEFSVFTYEVLSRLREMLVEYVETTPQS